MSKVLGIQEIYIFQNEDTEHGFHVWIFPRHKWMDKFGTKIQSVRPIIEYAKTNMSDETNIAKVRNAVLRVKMYLN